MVDLQGEKIGLVLKGVLEVTVSDEVFLLDEGDCIWYPANVPHSWRAVEGESIEVIWVLTFPHLRFSTNRYPDKKKDLTHEFSKL